MRARPTSRVSVSGALFWGLCAFVAVAGLWNAAQYPPGQGYDAVDHIAYADGLIADWDLPHGDGEYYTPPGFYLVAGAAGWVAEQVGVGEPHRAAAALNVLFLLGTMVLVRLIARELWPGRQTLMLGAVAFVAFVPVTLKTTAMFHPEVLSLFVSTLALWLCVRTFADWRWVFALGVALGGVQLVRAWGLLTVGAIVLALLAGRRWREVAIALVIAGAIAAPWYVHQRVEYGGQPTFPRPTDDKPPWERRPLAFYVDPGVPDVIANPFRRHFLNRAIPTTYTEIWGDYFGVWKWQGARPPDDARGELRLQSVLGLLPTLLAIGGWIALLVATLRKLNPPRLALALLPGLALLGFLYFTVSFPTADGDVLKGTYMLTAVVGWAFGFGYALERLRGNWKTLAIALCVVCAVLELPFLFY